MNDRTPFRHAREALGWALAKAHPRTRSPSYSDHVQCSHRCTDAMASRIRRLCLGALGIGSRDAPDALVLEAWATAICPLCHGPAGYEKGTMGHRCGDPARLFWTTARVSALHRLEPRVRELLRNHEVIPPRRPRLKLGLVRRFGDLTVLRPSDGEAPERLVALEGG